MSSRFTGDPLQVTTVNEEFMNGSEGEESLGGGESEGSIGSRTRSGSVNNAPEWMWFGADKCRAIFEIRQDGGQFKRVCGHNTNNARCNRSGHAKGIKAGEGYYETVLARKFIDGKLESRLTEEEYQQMENRRRQGVQSELKAAAKEVAYGTPVPYETVTQEVGSTSLQGGSTFEFVSPSTSISTSGGEGSGSKRMRLAEEGMPTKDQPDHSKEMALLTSQMEKLILTMSKSMSHLSNQIVSLQEANQAGKLKSEKTSGAVNKALTEGFGGTSANTKRETTSKTGPARKFASITAVGEGMSKQDRPVGLTRWYGVAHGRAGAQCVTDNYQEAADLTVGVPRNVMKSFKTQEEASDFVSNFTNNAGPEWYYVVTNNSTGTGAIYDSWGEAQVYVVGVSCATCKKFRSFFEAQAYLQGHLDSYRNANTGYDTSDDSEDDLDDSEGGIPRVSEERGGESQDDDSEYEDNDHQSEDLDAKVARLRGGGRTDLSYEEYLRQQEGAFQHTRPMPKKGKKKTKPSVKKASYPIKYPPSELMGSDQSTKVEDEMFGLNVNVGERELRDNLTPPFLTTEQKVGLVQNAVDVTALPGMFSGSSGGDQTMTEEWSHLSQAMEELVNQGREAGENGGRSDLSWRSNKRISLNEIKNTKDLRKRAQVLMKLMPKIQNRMNKLTSVTCTKAGMTDKNLIQAWANQGYLPVMIMQTYNCYLNLHQHLLLGAEANGWEYARIEKEHYVDELRLIRQTADSRLQCICLTYIMLRDGSSQNWFCSSIQQERNQTFFNPTRNVNAVCPKCNTSIIHGSDPDTCPWKNQTDKKARNNAANLIRKWKPGTDPNNADKTEGDGGE